VRAAGVGSPEASEKTSKRAPKDTYFFVPQAARLCR
jgi:hypothetical protein